jgi:hypothetical protein
MEFSAFVDLLKKNGVDLVHKYNETWLAWTPEVEDTLLVYAETDGRVVLLDCVEVIIAWSERGLTLNELCFVRSMLSKLCYGKDVIPFSELIKQLIKEQGSYSEYVKAVIQIEDEGATKEDLDRAYDFFMESDDCTLISQELLDVLADK